jgi:hypothetical protein
MADLSRRGFIGLFAASTTAYFLPPLRGWTTAPSGLVFLETKLEVLSERLCMPLGYVYTLNSLTRMLGESDTELRRRHHEAIDGRAD